MKKKFFSILLAVVGLSILTGCYDTSRSQANIQLVFPDSELYHVPDTINKYVVRDRSGQIYYVEENGNSATTNSMTIVKIFNEK